MHVREMAKTHPNSAEYGHALWACIEECFACAQACTACADACLYEDGVDNLRDCIRTNLDCADLCLATGSILTRHVGGDERSRKALIQACASLCRTCGEECRKHAAMHEHCRICAESCAACERACNEALAPAE